MADTPVTLTHELGDGARNNNNDMFGGGGSWTWIILLFFLFGRGRGFGDDGVNTNTVVGLTNEMLLNNIQQLLFTQFQNTNNNMNQGFQTVNNGICGINLEMCKGFGALTHQIDLGFCDAKQVTRDEGNATRALINDLVTQNLRERLNAAESALNNANQTAAIVNALRPYPTPAFIAPNPAVPFADGFGHGFGNKHAWA